MILDFVKRFKKKDQISLHGRDLSIWNYLGFTNIPKGSISCRIHFFVLRDNDKMRDFHLETPFLKEFRDHPWISNVHLWKANQIPHRFIVSTWPSNYMLSKSQSDGYDWDNDKKEWIVTRNTEGNVVSLDFKKK